MFDQSAERKAPREDSSNTQVKTMAAMHYAGLAGLLALMAATPSFAQSRTTMPNGHPSHYCLPTTVGQRARATGLLRRLACFPQGLVSSDAASHSLRSPPVGYSAGFGAPARGANHGGRSA